MSEEHIGKDYIDQVIARQLDENHRIHRRLEELEESMKKQGEITLALERMSINLEHVLNQLELQNQRLKKMEEAPLETNKKVRDALITTVVGGVIGAVVAKLLTML